MYKRYSVSVNTIYVCNDSQICHENVKFVYLRANKLKEILITCFINSYN